MKFNSITLHAAGFQSHNRSCLPVMKIAKTFLFLYAFLYSQKMYAQLAPITRNDTLCGPGIAHLSAAGCEGGTLKYYDAATGGNLVFTGSDYSPDLAVTDTFYASCTDAENSEGPRAMVIGKIYAPPTSYAGPDQQICVGSVAGNIMIPLQGRFGGSADSGTFYLLYYLPNNLQGVPASITANKGVKIGLCPPPSNCSFSFIPPQGGPVDDSSCALSFIDSIKLGFSFDTNDPAGPCEVASDTTIVHLYSSVHVGISFNQTRTICADSTVTLAGFVQKYSASGSCALPGTGIWSGGTGKFGDNINLPNGIVTNTYTPSAAEISAGFVQLYLTSTMPLSSPCSQVTDTLLITINRCAPFCTFTQGFYASKHRKACTSSGAFTATDLITRSINNMPGRTYDGAASASSEDNNFNSTLKNYGRANHKIRNNLLAQTITLALNIYVSANLGNSIGTIRLKDGWIVTRKRSAFSTCNDPWPATCAEDSAAVKSWHLPSNVITALGSNNTVQDLLHMAIKALGRKLPKEVTSQDIAIAEDIINNAFDGCRYLVGFSECKKTCANLDMPCSPSELPLTVQPGASFNAGKRLQASVYPNPYNDQLKFSIESPYSGPGTLDIYTLLGQKIKEFQGSFFRGETKIFNYRVPVEYRGTLMYILKIGDQQVNGKLIRLN